MEPVGIETVLDLVLLGMLSILMDILIGQVMKSMALGPICAST